MTSAPRVNQIRLFSSVALAKAPKLILAASCSAADAMTTLPYPTGRKSQPRSGGSGGFRLFRLCLADGANDDLAPLRLDGGNGRGRGAGDLDRDRACQFALGEQPDAV